MEPVLSFACCSSFLSIVEAPRLLDDEPLGESEVEKVEPPSSPEGNVFGSFCIDVEGTSGATRALPMMLVGLLLLCSVTDGFGTSSSSGCMTKELDMK